MDKNNEIPKDMVEQLLKYVPSQEETALLDEHSQKLDEMARADRWERLARRSLPNVV